MGKLAKISVGFIVVIGLCVILSLFSFVSDPVIRGGNILLQKRHYFSARMIYQYFDMLGNKKASNNLGVLYLRKRGVKFNRAKALAYFEQASDAGILAGTYNFVYATRLRKDTPESVVKRQFALLNQNISQGDIPSYILGAERFSPSKWKKLVPNQRARILELYELAAETGDPDYIYQYANELEVRSLDHNDAEMMAKALRHYIRVYELGQPRGAEAAGTARELMNWNYNQTREEVLGRPASEWTSIAAEKGVVSAKCDWSLDYFSWNHSVTNSGFKPSSARAVITKIRRKKDPALLSQALMYLGACAKGTFAIRFPNPPFGDVALYARKRRGTVTSLANSPDRAKYVLGVLFTLGVHVEEDKDRARKYFNEIPKWPNVSEWVEFSS